MRLEEEKVWDLTSASEPQTLNRPDQEDLKDDERRTQTYIEQTFANSEFRPIAKFFESISYTHVVPQLVRDPARYTGQVADPFGGDFLEQIGGTHKAAREARIRRIGEALQYAIPQLSELRWDRDKQGAAHLYGKYKHWRPSGAWQMETEFSDGTLRLIGLLWALQVGKGPLLLEEPELSLHPGLVRYLVQMMLGVQKIMQTSRQTFISTHSQELLSDQGLDPHEILLIKPSAEGSQVQVAANDEQILNLLNVGFSMAEAVLPQTAPPDVHQMLL